MHIGEVIGLLIKKRGFKQVDFAEKIKKSPTALSQIIKGTYNPNPETLSRISKELNVPQTILYFLAITEEDMPDDKKELYQTLAPEIRRMLIELFGSEDLKLLDEMGKA